MKRILTGLLVILCLFSLTIISGAVSVNQVFVYTDTNWGKGGGTTADGLWKYEWFARETETFAAMDWNASGSYYEAQYSLADASDTHWYCRVRNNGTNLHPGAQADATITFVAPESGKIRYTVNLTRQVEPSTNGNTVRVMVNDEIIPIKEAEDYLLNDTTPLAVDLTFEVEKGDLVRLLVGSQGNSGSDGVDFSGLKVQYLSGDNLEAEKPSYIITCVGDSITEGMGTTGGLKGAKAFPSVLKGLLDEANVADFNVVNCGKSATTALTSGDRPYKQSAEYATSLTSSPNVVIICLGANDSKAINWNPTKYKTDYKNLISEYINLPSKPTVYLFYTTYVADQSKTGCTRTVIQNQILPIQYEIAEELNLKIIDLNTLTKNHSTKYADGVHPNDELQAMMANYIYNALCSEGVGGLTSKNANATVKMIDPAAEDLTTDASDTASSEGSTATDSSDTASSEGSTATDSSDTASSEGSTVTDSGITTDGTVTDTSSDVPSDLETGADATDSTSHEEGSNSSLILWACLGAGALVLLCAARVYIWILRKAKK